MRLGAAFIRLARQHVAIPEDANILDVGCGFGRLIKELELDSLWNGTYLGIEPMSHEAEAAANLASGYQKSFEVQHVDLRNEFYNPEGAVDPLEYRFPVEDGTVDVVFFHSVFTHLHAAICRHYLAESRRVLKVGGVIHASWFLCDEERVEAIRRGIPGLRSTRKFRARYDEGWTSNPEKPLTNIGFPRPLVESWYLNAGFTIKHVHIGDWKHHRPISQDAVIAVSE